MESGSTSPSEVSKNTGKLERALEMALEQAVVMGVELTKRGHHPIVAKRIAQDRDWNLPKESEVPILDRDQAPFGQP